MKFGLAVVGLVVGCAGFAGAQTPSCDDPNCTDSLHSVVAAEMPPLREAYKPVKGLRVVYENQTSVTQSMGVEERNQASSARVEFTVMSDADANGEAVVLRDFAVRKDGRYLYNPPFETTFTATGISGQDVMPFFPVPKADKIEMPLALPIFPLPVKVQVVVSADGKSVEYRSDAPQSVAPAGMGREMTVQKSATTMTLADGLPQSVEMTLKFEVAPSPEQVIKVEFENTLKLVESKVLSADALSSETKEAAAVAGFMRSVMESGMAQGAPPTEAIVKQFKDLSEQYPDGRYTDFMDEVKQAIEPPKNAGGEDESAAAAGVGTPTLSEGDVPPPIKATMLDGKEVTLDEFKGKVVLLDFWATWCGPCKAEMPLMKKLYDDYADKGLVMVGISLDRGEEELKAYIEKEEIKWAQVLSSATPENQKISSAYKIVSIPTIYLVGKDGKIVSGKLRGEKLVEKVAELLKD